MIPLVVAAALAAQEPLYQFEPSDAAGARIEIWAGARARQPVSRYLYGKFTEHLWWNVQNCLWAQVLKNSGFESWEMMGEGWQRIHDWASRGGFSQRFPRMRLSDRRVAPWWEPCGNDAVYRIEPSFNGDCQRIEAESVDGGAGIEQFIFLPLHRTGHFDLSFFAKGTARLRVSVHGPERVLATAEARVASLDWTRHSLALSVEGVAKGTPLLFRVELAEPGSVAIDHMVLFPTDHLQGFDPDVVRLLRESRLPLLRFPGGNFVSGYHWEDGIGPAERRPARRNPAWGDIEPNHVGIDEYMRFCKLIGCEPLVCVNAGDGTAREAAHWVEYCNGSTKTKYGALRASNGHPEPYNVKFWEIGNELYGKWQIGHCTPEEYARRYAEFIEAMRAVDPTLRFIAIGQDLKWNAPLIRESGRLVRTLAVHELPGGNTDKTAPPREVFEELMAFPFALRTKLHSLADQMRAASLTPRLAITEAQIFTGGQHPNNSSHAEALWLAGILHMAIREGDLVELITHSALVNHAGGLRKEREFVYANPVHYTSLLYATQSGRWPVRIKVTTPHYHSPGRWIPSTKADRVPVLDAIALLNDARTELTLLVINRSPDTSFSVPITLHGFRAAKRVRTRALAAPGYMTRNTLDGPDAVHLVDGDSTSPTHTFPPHSLTALIFRLSHL